VTSNLTTSDIAPAMPATAPSRSSRQRSRTRLLPRLLLYVALLIGASIMVAPFIWMILSSLKSSGETSSFDWLPETLRWRNYTEAMSAAPFGRYFLNTVVLAIGQTLLTLTFATMAGYALAQLPIRGRGPILGYVLSLLMVPYTIVMVPLFLVVKSIPLFGGNDILGQGGTGWLNTWWALIIPPAISPLYIFLARQFYLDLPPELGDAARMDGAGEFTIFARIMTPLIKPALVTITVFQVEAAWNSFLWPLLVTRDPSIRPIQTGLAIFSQSSLVVQWPYLMAGTVLATLPMILLFVVLQRYFVEGMASSGLKG
jgi:multiple sugar transport system permease protein